MIWVPQTLIVLTVCLILHSVALLGYVTILMGFDAATVHFLGEIRNKERLRGYGEHSLVQLFYGY